MQKVNEQQQIQEVFIYRRIPSNELDAKSTTPLAGRVITPTRPLPTPADQQ